MVESGERIKIWGILVTIICFGLVHTGGLVWFLSGMATTVAYQSKQIEEIKQIIAKASDDTYRRADAARDFNLVNTVIESLTRRVEILESKTK